MDIPVYGNVRYTPLCLHGYFCTGKCTVYTQTISDICVKYLKGFSEMSKPNNFLYICISTFKLKINMNKHLLVNFTV